MISLGHAFFGEVPEWSNGPVSKTGVPFGVPRVRIPPSPLNSCASACICYRVKSHKPLARQGLVVFLAR